MRNRRRQIEVFNLSFLDVISCGFGAIILLLVISKISEPRVIEQSNLDLSGLVVRLEGELHEIRGETQIFNRQLIAKQEQLSAHKEKLARLAGRFERYQRTVPSCQYRGRSAEPDRG